MPTTTTLLVGESWQTLSIHLKGFDMLTSDCAPHWGPPAFTDWDDYAPTWANLVEWLAAAS